ncbi:hypothetical protein BC477_07920 [Clavibacter michiganensis subsp. michiganensis]|uniref:Uncharacterized protein n=1 Tax=Clavibacter michiganensis subsp. michiganensis TaxID=33013 RepID=A0A251XMF8_CLAMM|nr:hypothetical protein BC477_07920 [Clavibacter michiganensis subsp. michiganensis]OUE04647.1 hypothetical protein CMMCAS07_06850 [Clavibacter michiganensis subsp. michiganensis]
MSSRVPTGAVVPIDGVCTTNQRPPDAWKRSVTATRAVRRTVAAHIRTVRRRIVREVRAARRVAPRTGRTGEAGSRSASSVTRSSSMRSSSRAAIAESVARSWMSVMGTSRVEGCGPPLGGPAGDPAGGLADWARRRRSR